jgi:hypothetical protein
MITCRELVAALGDFVSGELSDEWLAHVEKHLVGCGPCLALVESYRMTIQLSRQLRPLTVPAHLLARVQAVLATKAGQGPDAAGAG